MTATTGDGATTRAERAYRRALLAYPRRYRRERGEEIVSTLMDAAEHGARVGAGDGAAPTASVGGPRVDMTELGALVAAGLRRRARSENRWWDAVRWAAVIMIAFVVLRSAARLRLQLTGLEAHGWLLPRGLDDLGWWLPGPPATVLLGVLAILALARAWVLPASAVCGVLVAVRIGGLVEGDRASVPLVTTVVLAWAAGPLALAVRGRAASRRPWAPSLVVALAPLAAPALPSSVISPDQALLAVLGLAALVRVEVARGLAVAAGILLVGSLASGPYGFRSDAVLLGLVSLAWAELLDRVIVPRVGRRPGQGPSEPRAVGS